MSPLQNEEVLSPENPQRHHATGRMLRRCGVEVLVYWCLSGRSLACTDEKMPGPCMAQRHDHDYAWPVDGPGVHPTEACSHLLHG